MCSDRARRAAPSTASRLAIGGPVAWPRCPDHASWRSRAGPLSFSLAIAICLAFRYSPQVALSMTSAALGRTATRLRLASCASGCALIADSERRRARPRRCREILCYTSTSTKLYACTAVTCTYPLRSAHCGDVRCVMALRGRYLPTWFEIGELYECTLEYALQESQTVHERCQAELQRPSMPCGIY